MADIIVIGAGAAGMMAALSAAKKGHRVTILEKNEKAGKKIYITGKGRCNITNAADMETIMANVVSNPRFLYSSFHSFTNLDMMKLLEEAGLPLKTERGNRVFPVSDKSSDVIRTLTDLLYKEKVNIYYNKAVKSLIFEEMRNNQGEAIPGMTKCTGVLTEDGRKRYADCVICATGGLSYPSTGSTGDGYEFARAAGHGVTELSPALVPFSTEEDWVHEMAGLALRNVSVTITQGKKKVYSEFGEMLFTHFGVSGPAILSGSSLCAKYLKKGNLILHIDLKPALAKDVLNTRLLKEFAQAENKQISNVAAKLFPQSLIPHVLRQAEIAPDTVIHDLTKEQRSKLIEVTKDFKITLNGLRGYNEAIITQGGVKVKEVNPATMESKLVKGLKFAGEVLDVDALTGGYNLQIAWSTGYLAGSTIE